MSTPRTDAACGWPWGHHGRIETGDLRWSPDGPFVHSSVMRELERENARLQKQLEEWRQSTQWFAEWAEKKQELERENAALREVLREIADASGFDNIGNWARKKAKNALAKEAQP